MLINLIHKEKFKRVGISVIDNFFSDQTCNSLREFALNPKCGYHDVYEEYRAINFDILRSELSLVSTIKEFEDKIKFLGKIKYVRSWCFCYDNKSKGVPPHADPSYVNINVWVTPNESVNDFNKNGLKIYHKKRNTNVPHSLYNGNLEYISREIKDSKFTIVPYKYNRAVIFLGSMYHETLGVDMKDGEENMRVSYTYLFDKI